jgi:transcriptional regulator with XRE-family HTH domain
VIVRIGEVIGDRVRAAREKAGWTQTELGKRVGQRLGQRGWSRQVVSAAEQGRRAYTAAELLTFADVLGVSVTFLLTPPPDVSTIEIAPGVSTDTMAVVDAVTSHKDTDTAERFAETGRRFFSDLADLRQLLNQVFIDMEAFVADLQAVHGEREDKNTVAQDLEGES